MIEESGTRHDEFVRIVGPLLDRLAPKVVVIVGADGDVAPDEAPPLAADHVMFATGIAGLRDALGSATPPQMICIAGHPGWHTVRQHVRELHHAQRARVADCPLVMVRGTESEPVSAATPVLRRAQLVSRTAMVRNGLRLAVEAGARHLSAAALWSESNGGFGLIIPAGAARACEEDLGTIDSWLQDLNAVERENDELVRLGTTLLELLEQYEDATARLLRSRRFLLGDRIIRNGRRLRRRPDRFPIQGELEAQSDALARAREQLAHHLPPPLAPTGASALRVTYLLPKLKIAGGVLGVAQLASELRLLGVDSRIVALKGWGDHDRWRFLVQPTLFDTADELLDGFHESDIVVATHYTTASWAHELVRNGRARHSVYFLQDYEPWFFPAVDETSRDRVRQTFGLISRKIVKSDWLRRLLQDDGYETEKIPLGLDLGFFYPRPVDCPSHPVIIAMGRPRTPRRGFDSVVAALEQVKQARPATEIVLFGEDLSERTLPFDYRAEGVVGDQEHLAQLYSRATVHLDGSDFQAFGRPALEAMACGTASVLTDVGGVSEYARDESNCLLVPPRSPERFAAALIRLIDNQELRQRIIQRGFETVLEYSMRLEARRTLSYFEETAASAPGS